MNLHTAQSAVSNRIFMRQEAQLSLSSGDEDGVGADAEAETGEVEPQNGIGLRRA